MLYNEHLLTSCDLLVRRCSTICGEYRGSAWLYDKLMRYFSSEPAAASVTLPCQINLVGSGTAEIGRDGSLVMRANHDAE